MIVAEKPNISHFLLGSSMLVGEWRMEERENDGGR